MLNVKTVPFQVIKLSKSSILSGTTTPRQSGSGSDGKEKVLHIPQSSSITGASPSDCLVSYLGYSLQGEGSYTSSEKQSMYPTAPTDWENV